MRQTWSQHWGEQGFETGWRQALHDGVVAGTATPPLRPPQAVPVLPAAPPTAPLTLLLRPDPASWDGRFANNPWLQECPKPLTRQVWGNAALISPTTAALLGLAEDDGLLLSAGERQAEAPVLPLPGMADGVVLLSLGFGRRRAGAIGDGIGTDAYPLRDSAEPWQRPLAGARRSGNRHAVLRLGAEPPLEGAARDLFPELRPGDPPLPAAAAPPSLYPPPPPDPEVPAWAMVIDTALCIGCNACVVACQAENNIPVVGPEEVARGRDMHWLRIDTHNTGSSEAPRLGFQPVPCMQCEAAPCEPVCPVAASVHDGEGLNVQVYNRCMGTRFCQANCPYKVRRFNFRGYAEGREFANRGAPVVAVQHNPEVTLRSRGVMEKCTYCTQRISAARRDAEKSGLPPSETQVVTACQSACPAAAISFGKLHAERSHVP